MSRQSIFNVKRSPYLFIAPYFIFYITFGLFPMIFSFYISLTDWKITGQKTFIWFKNYIFLFTQDTLFWKSILNTLLFMAEAVPILLIGGLLMAVLVNSKSVKLKSFFRLANFLPYIITPVAIGVIFSLFFDISVGVVNKFLVTMGLTTEPIYWLGNPTYLRIIVGLIIAWKYIGYHMTMYLAGISGIPVELYEAATVDGASPWHEFIHITVPLIKPVFVFLLITDIIGGFQVFEEPLMLFADSMGNVSGSIGGPDHSCLTAVMN
jgi:cellobiose transport system permease protein